MFSLIYYQSIKLPTANTSSVRMNFQWGGGGKNNVTKLIRK